MGGGTIVYSKVRSWARYFFVANINDPPEEIRSLSFLFAGDLKIVKQVVDV